MNYSLNHNFWYGGKPVDISLPDDWDVTLCGMAADKLSPLSKEELKKRIDSPFGTKTIRELAEGKHEVAIVFDDMSRGTPCREAAEIILDELLSAGIDKRHIRFICALGSHGVCMREDFEKKLGKQIIKEYAVFNHNAFQNCRYVGTTSGGVEVKINEELMRCDLKIGIGSISPHPLNGYGGGGKLVMIGTAHIDTIDALHKASGKCSMEKKIGFAAGVGNLNLDGMRKEIEEGVKMIGFDFKVDAILNSACEIVECTAGDPNEEYYEGVKLSADLNFADCEPSEQDVVIANANVKANEATIAVALSSVRLKKSGGIVVLVDQTQDGQVVHQYSGISGYFIGGKVPRSIRHMYPDVRKIIFFTPYPDLTSGMTFTDPEHLCFAETWDEVMELLKEFGSGTKAAVLSDATIMAFDYQQRRK